MCFLLPPRRRKEEATPVRCWLFEVPLYFKIYSPRDELISLSNQNAFCCPISEIEVGVPDAKGRAQILRVLLRGVPHAIEDSPSGVQAGNSNRVIEGIAARTHGFVGADLQLLVKEAALQTLRRTRVGVCDGFKGGKADGPEKWEDGDELIPTITRRDFDAALPLVAPSGLREVAVEVPTVRWGDIGGMEGVKQSLKEVVEWPLRHPEAFQRMGISPPRGVLLYGPPGCSKTLMARALATESGMNFLAVKGEKTELIAGCLWRVKCET